MNCNAAMKELQAEFNVNQATIARITGCRPSMVSDMSSKADYAPPGDDLIRVSRAFGVSADYLLGASATRSPYRTVDALTIKIWDGAHMDFAAAFRVLISERGISQKELVERVGWNEPAMSRFASGQDRKVDIRILIKMATELNVSIDFMLGLTLVPTIRTDEDNFCHVLHECYTRASERDKNLVGTVLNEYLTDQERTMNYDLR